MVLQVTSKQADSSEIRNLQKLSKNPSEKQLTTTTNTTGTIRTSKLLMPIFERFQVSDPHIYSIYNSEESTIQQKSRETPARYATVTGPSVVIPPWHIVVILWAWSDRKASALVENDQRSGSLRVRAFKKSQPLSEVVFTQWSSFTLAYCVHGMGFSSQRTTAICHPRWKSPNPPCGKPLMYSTRRMKCSVKRMTDKQLCTVKLWKNKLLKNSPLTKRKFFKLKRRYCKAKLSTTEFVTCRKRKRIRRMLLVSTHAVQWNGCERIATWGQPMTWTHDMSHTSEWELTRRWVQYTLPGAPSAGARRNYRGKGTGASVCRQTVNSDQHKTFNQETNQLTTELCKWDDQRSRTQHYAWTNFLKKKSWKNVPAPGSVQITCDGNCFKHATQSSYATHSWKCCSSHPVHAC